MLQQLVREQVFGSEPEKDGRKQAAKNQIARIVVHSLLETADELEHASFYAELAAELERKCEVPESESIRAPARRAATQRFPVAKLGVVALVGLGLGLAYHFGAFAGVSSPEQLAHSMRALGVWGYVAFVVAYAVFQPFGVPGTVFVIAAPLIWPWPIAFALSMVGTMSASVIGFSFARFVARDWVAQRIPERFAKHDRAIERHGFQTVFFLRLIFWMPQVLHSFLGVSKVRFSTHFWGSLLGYIPPLLLLSYLAGTMFDANGKINSAAWPPLAGLVGTSLLLAALARAFERRRAARATAATPTND